MARVDYYVHGRGRGHASRARSALDELRRRGHEVTVFAGGDAAPLLNDVAVMPRTPLRRGATAPFRLVWRAAGDLARRPDVVVSDGDHASIVAGRIAGIATVACGHGLVFSSCRLPAGLDRRALAMQQINAAPERLARWRLAVHFLPIEPMGRRVLVARPDLPAELEEEPGDDGSFVGYFSGVEARAVVAELRAAGVELVAFGAGGKPFDRARFRERLRRATGVVATAGSNLLAECVSLQKPILALYPRGHHEQALNAALAERAGVAMAAPLEQCDVRRFVERARRRDFAVIPLRSALPPMSQVLGDLVDRL